jgi:hypothetical protein
VSQEIGRNLKRNGLYQFQTFKSDSAWGDEGETINFAIPITSITVLRGETQTQCKEEDEILA